MVERSSMSILSTQKKVFDTLKREYGVMENREFSATAFMGELLLVFQEHNNTCLKPKRQAIADRLLSTDYVAIKN